MDSAVYLQFKVNVRNLVKSRLYLTKETGIQPSDFAKWPYYEYEYFLEDFQEYMEEREKKEKEEEAKYKKDTSITSKLNSLPNNFKLPKLPK